MISVVSLLKHSLKIVIGLWLMALTLGLVFSINPGSSAVAKAQSVNFPLQLSISPSVLEVAIKPGKTITKAFQVKNNGLEDTSLKFILRDFEADGQTGQPHLLDDSTFPYAKLANADFQLGDEFLLPAGESTQAVLKLTIPENAPQKDWYFVLLAKTSNEGSFAGVSQAHPQGSIGANILVRVTNDNTIPLHWQLDLNLPPVIDSLQTLSFEPLIHNDSITYAIPEINIVILDWRGKIVSEQQALPQRVLSESSRRMLAARPQKDDPRSLEGVPFSFAPRFAIGPYKVRASVINDFDGPIVVEQTIYAIPFSIMAALFILGIGFIVIRRLPLWTQRRQTPLDNQTVNN